MNAQNGNYDQKLEGLRGFCAVLVAVTHFFTFDFFGAINSPAFPVIFRLQFAHEAVLLFFIISGYVIGLSHIKSPYNYKNVVNYLKKRLVRLYPIYLLALVISFAYGYKSISVTEIVGHLFFLHEFLVKTIAVNPVLWSLGYEVAYYIVFIVLWMLNGHTKNLYLIISIFIIAAITCSPAFNVFKSLLIGWIFWLSGLYVARLSNREGKNNAGSDIPVLSCILILLATKNLQSGALIIHLLHINFNIQEQINLTDVVYLPVCTLIILNISGKHFRYINYLKLMAYFIPALNIFILFYFKHDILSDPGWVFGITCFCLSILFGTIKYRKFNFSRLCFAGKISYAIYVFHFPLGLLLSFYLSKYLSGVTLLLTGLLSWLFLTFIFSYYIEIVFQPHIKRYLLPKPAIKEALKIA